MIEYAKTKILAVDHSKFDEVAFSEICDISLLDIVVTDERPSDEWLEFFKENRILCIFPTDTTI